MKSSEGKIYLAVIKETLSVRRPKFPKCFGEIKTADNFSSRVFSANSRRFHLNPQPESKKPRASPFETVCAPPTGWVASIHLRGSETRCWGICELLSRSAVLSPKCQEQYRRTRREAGKIPQPPGHCLPVFRVRFQRIRLRQNAQDKGRAEGSKKKQDKGRASQVTPARVTSSRSAGRFKGFRALEHGRMWGSHLSLGAHFGVWYCANAHGWPLSAGVSVGIWVKIIDLKGQKGESATQQASLQNRQTV